MKRRSLRNLTARGRSLEKSLQCFQLAHNFRLAGSTRRLQRPCTINGKGPRSFDKNIHDLVTLLASTLIFSVGNHTLISLTTVLSVNTTVS